MSTTPARLVRQSPQSSAPISAALPYSWGFDAMLDAVHETHRRFRHGAYAVPCPDCHAPAGELCLARRSVHSARRQAHRDRPARNAQTPVTAAVASRRSY
ncbi:hypothetical protein NJL88_34420 [Streptomyces sp. DK15]|uniref:zinc finger domain-containing protein n=1 Tax=Streptomyces sp. DK15 TaxID=2957499 RepID=UPI0029A08AA9|nr:hypothetical protein [Streptomyces sp. DK15]MDX2395065.1 hypothetical protein [Streptomyces sp. DK15]